MNCPDHKQDARRKNALSNHAQMFPPADFFFLAPEVLHEGISLTLVPDHARKGICGVLTGVPPVVVEVPNVDLDGGVILGSDELPGDGALPWDVQVDSLSL
eukprot:CAMPEP_0171456592 /NCGR_PEP_ID=MMETSP0945-20130129/3015_1 /TAXON_ID=109269 /ORGANISM="Vaucheria litorea, Strain CCMP2940" /LENGTH=100 /DNA_ID=CAMNT_0011982043 /DNA_START=204 /DNA_END=505 /DNA_ORIENTATION=-